MTMTVDREKGRWFYDGGWVPGQYARALPPDIMAPWRRKLCLRPAMCLAVNEAWDRQCTRPTGHCGRHHAGDGLIIYAVWS